MGDLESNQNEAIFESNHIHPRIGQFILVTICQRFTNDFKHCILNTDPFKISTRRNSIILFPPINNQQPMAQYAFIRNFIDEKLIKLCSIARDFQNNMLLNKASMFPERLINDKYIDYEFHPVYGQLFPSPNYLALSQLAEMIQPQSSKLLEWTKHLLLKEDWIGMDAESPFSSSVIDLFAALNVFADVFFKTIRKLEIRTLLSNPKMYQTNGQKWNVSKLRDSFIVTIKACIDYYAEYILSISGKIQDIIPESADIHQLNTKNLQKCDNFNLKEIYRKSKKAVVKPRRSSS